MPQLAAIAVENNTHPDCIGNSAQVGGVCCKLSGKYPGDCRFPDTGCFADCFLGYAAFLGDFGETFGDVLSVVHVYVHCI